MDLTNKTLNNQVAIISLLIICIVFVSGLIFSYLISVDIIKKKEPLIDAIMEVKFETAQAHLWFEEMISGDTTIRYEKVTNHIKNAFWYVNTIINGGTNKEGNYLPLENKNLRNRIFKVKDILLDFKNITEQRFNNPETSLTGSPIDEKHDKVYITLINDIDFVETEIQTNILAENKYRNVTLAVMSLIFVFFIFFLLTKFITLKKDFGQKILIQKEEKKIVQQKLSENEKFLKKSQQVAKIGSFKLNFQDGFWECTEELNNIFGITENYEKNMANYFALVHSEDRDMMQEYFRTNILKKHEFFDKEYRIVDKKNGTVKWVHGLGELIFTYDNSLSTMIGTVQDISDRIKADEQQLKTHETLRMSVDNMQNAYVLRDENLKVLEWNNAAEKIFGYSKNEIIGKNLTRHIMVEEEQQQTENNLRRLFSGETAGYSMKNNNINKKGKLITCEWFNSPLIDNEGKIFAILSIGKDITEKIAAETKLQKWEHIFKHSGWGIAVSSQDGKSFELMNPIFAKMYGYTMEELVGNPVIEIFAPESRKEIPNAIALSFQKGHHIFESKHIRKDGSIFPVRVAVTTVKNEQGDVLYRVAYVQDITERKRAEEVLINSEQKLREANATKDKFFSIIAHDLKSPFSTMLGFTELLFNKFDKYDVQKQKKFLGILKQDVQNTYNLLENLLLWSRSQRGIIDFKPEKEKLYLLSIETIGLLSQMAAKKSISLKNEIPKNIIVNADKDMLTMIIRNLISNAIKFTPKEGEIVIKASIVNDDDNHESVEIFIKDSGVGMSEKIQSNLFKISENISRKGTENETGTGLGLILCKEFAEKHGGKIWVESELGIGSTFSFTIPNNED